MTQFHQEAYAILKSMADTYKLYGPNTQLWFNPPPGQREFILECLTEAGLKLVRASPEDALLGGLFTVSDL
jgi:hypothetical protein